MNAKPVTNKMLPKANKTLSKNSKMPKNRNKDPKDVRPMPIFWLSVKDSMVIVLKELFDLWLADFDEEKRKFGRSLRGIYFFFPL